MPTAFEDILRVLFRRRCHIGIFIICMIAFPMTFAYIFPPQYKAEAMIYLRPGSYKRPFLPTVSSQQPGYMPVSLEDVGSEAAIILSRPVLESVVDETGLDKEGAPPKAQLLKYCVYHIVKRVKNFLISLDLLPEMDPREKAIILLKKTVKIDVIKKRTKVISVAWKDSDPELAQAVVNSLVKHYKTHHVQLHAHTNALDTITKEMKLAEKELNAIENQLEAYKQKNGISDIKSQRVALINTIAQTRKKLDLFSGKNSAKNVDLSNIDDDTVYLDLRKRLTDLELQRIDIVTKFGKDDQKVANINAAIEQVESLMKERQVILVASWKRVVTRGEERLATLDKADGRIRAMNREVLALTARYNLSREKVHELKIADALAQANVASPKVAEWASLPAAPAFPNKLLMLLISCLLGVIGGITYAFAYEWCGNRVTDPEEAAELTQTPVRAVLPRYPRAVRMDPKRFAETAASGLMPLRNMLEPAEDGRRQIMLVSPASRGEIPLVTSSISAFVAKHFSASVVHVALREQDRKSDNGKNLTTVCDQLDGLEFVITRDPTDSCDCLTISLSPEDTSLSQKKVDAMVARLKEKYNYVIFDIAADMNGQIHFRFSPYVDSSWLLVTYDKTNRKQLKRFATGFHENDVKLAGCIMTNYQNEIPGFIRQTVFQDA